MSRAHRLTALVGVLAIAGCPVAGFAQETTGRLVGRVRGTGGEPVPAASIMVTSTALQGSRGTQTDAKGMFVLLALPVGDYTVRIARMGYQPRVLESVTVRLGLTTALEDIVLGERVYSAESVQVTARATVLDPNSTLLGGSLSVEDYAPLPVERDYKALVVLLPHANPSTLGDPANFAGATGSENRYFVDGVDVTDPINSNGGTNLPYNFVQELQVRTGGYDAEYPGALGGTVNAITYSGGNQVSGKVFGFLTSNGLSATPRSLPGQSAPNQDFALYDLGFAVGGPVARDRLWYYVAYNPTFRSEDVPIPGWGTYVDHHTMHGFAAKLTWHANDRNTIVLTGIGDPGRGRSVMGTTVPPKGIDPFLTRDEQADYQVAAEGRHLIGDGLLIKSRWSLSSRAQHLTPDTDVGRSAPYTFIDSTGAWSGAGATIRNDNRAFTGAVSATWFQGDHEVKAGVAYQDSRLEVDTHYAYLQEFTATQYVTYTESFEGHAGSRSPSAFVQHTWRPTERLQISDGLRWDGQYIISSEDRVAQSILEGWQPRLGIAYQPGRLGTQKVYASLGRFYQDITTAPLFWYYSRGTQYLTAFYDHDPRLDPSGADTVAFTSASIQRAIAGLQGQFFDEFTLGYERQLGAGLKIDTRVVRRLLRQGLEDGFDPATGTFWFGNPGSGPLQAFPRMRREYTAFEVSAQGQIGPRLTILGSYVLSRNYGNYEGLFDSQFYNPRPNVNSYFDFIFQLLNGTGLLPNDRTHVFKLAGSYRVGHGLTIGMADLIASGSPVSELGGSPIPPYTEYIGARGSHGRTPTIRDINLRVGYELPSLPSGWIHPRLTVDVLHVASRREVLRYDEVHYRALDASGNEVNPNPNYRQPTVFVPPMAVRMGFETDF